MNLFQPASEFLPMIDEVLNSFDFNYLQYKCKTFIRSHESHEELTVYNFILCRFLEPLLKPLEELKVQKLRTISFAPLYITVM